MQSHPIAEIEAVFKKAEQLRESGNNEEALKEYTKVVYFAPRHWPAYFHLGVLFGKAGHNELAVSLLKRSADLNPDDRVIKNHLADHLMKLKQNEEAIVQLQGSWSLDPSLQNVAAPFKIGKILWESNRPREAIEYFDMAIAYAAGQDTGNDAETTRIVSGWFRGLCRMSLGDYQQAWKDYETRNSIPGVIVPELKGEKWTGQSLEQKTIFFAYEQRFGDIIQFIRFIPRLMDMGAKIVIQIPLELERLFRHSFPDVKLVLTTAPIPDYDYYQFITSVPAVLNLSKEETLLDPVPYLAVDETKITQLPVRKDTLLKVGLVWAGKPDPDRSIPLEHYIPLLKHRSVSFFSFQLGDKRNSLYEHAVGWLIHDIAPQIADFHDSAVMLKEMDLLITIDTAIAHQAGALGVPVWLMLLYFSDWRWELKRADNPWYPSMRLFRQQREGSWSETGKELELAFEEWVSLALKAKQKGIVPNHD